MIDFLSVLPAFAITVLVIVAVPGQGMAMVLRQSIVSGKEAAFYSVFGKDDAAYGHLPQYNQLIEVLFTDFSYTVNKRGPNLDLWNISIGLEEA